MIIQIIEQYHDYEEKIYFVETERLKPKENPIDDLVLKASKKKSFNQSVFVDVEEKRRLLPEDEFWEEPDLTNANVRLPKGSKPEKIVKLTIQFE